MLAPRHSSQNAFLLPRGYQWQDVDIKQEKDIHGPPETKTPSIHVGRTLIFWMPKPAIWDTLNEQEKMLRKRQYLCERYGPWCFVFLEDPPATRNQLGRVVVGKCDYYALFEAWSAPDVELQYHATMSLLEHGLRMSLDDFSSLRKALGMESGPSLDEREAANPINTPTFCSAKPPKTIKGYLDGVAQPLVQLASHLNIPIAPAPASVVSPVASTATAPRRPRKRRRRGTQAQPDIFQRIWDERNTPSNSFTFKPVSPFIPPLSAYLVDPTNTSELAQSANLKPFTTISRSKFAEYLQYKHNVWFITPDDPAEAIHFPLFVLPCVNGRRRLCHEYGQGKNDALIAAAKWRRQFIHDFIIVHQALGHVAMIHLDANGAEYTLDRVIRQLSLDVGVARHQYMATREFSQLSRPAQFGWIFAEFLENCLRKFESIVGLAGAAPMDRSPLARMERAQCLQEHMWPLFVQAVDALKWRISMGEAI